MLRYPLNRPVLLITTAGVINGTIIKASKDFFFCENVKFQDYSMDHIYLDRASVIAYSDLTEKEDLTPKNERKIQQAKIIKFNQID